MPSTAAMTYQKLMWNFLSVVSMNALALISRAVIANIMDPSDLRCISDSERSAAGTGFLNRIARSCYYQLSDRIKKLFRRKCLLDFKAVARAPGETGRSAAMRL